MTVEASRKDRQGTRYVGQGIRRGQKRTIHWEDGEALLEVGPVCLKESSLEGRVGWGMEDDNLR